MGSRSRRSSSKAPTKKREVDASLKGPNVSASGALLDVSTDKEDLAGASLKLGEVGAEAGINKKGAYGSASASLGEIEARLGRDEDLAQVKGTAKGPNANVEGYAGWGGVGFDAGASVGDISASGHIGRKGTDHDAAITGGLEAGGGGKLSFGANFGRDTDGDGVPNYGFNLGAKLGVGFNVGVDVERPMEHLKNAGSAIAGFFGF